MRRTLSLLFGSIGFTASAAAMSVAAQTSCAQPTTNEWLGQNRGVAPTNQLQAERVRKVSMRLDRAVARLKSRSAVLLTDEEVQAFTGSGRASIESRGLRAYLVRAVFPTRSPSLDVRWDGKRLDVFAGGLGCASFTKHPIVVFLEQKPRQVVVMATAAL